MKKLSDGKDFNKILKLKTLIKLAVNDEKLHVFTLMRMVTVVAGRNFLLCEIVAEGGKKRKWKFGNGLSIGKSIFL